MPKLEHQVLSRTLKKPRRIAFFYNDGIAADVTVGKADKLREQLNKAGIKFVERRDWDVKKRLVSSINKAQQLLDYKPQTNFREGLEAVYKWFVNNFENITKSAEF